jgi:hypothetical protein
MSHGGVFYLGATMLNFLDTVFELIAKAYVATIASIVDGWNRGERR